jgi:putative SOS response-associated peptidase YedK
MCGRTALRTSPADLREVFGLPEVPEFTPHYNIPPSQPVAVVRVLRRDPARRMDFLRWGLLPNWAKDPKIAHRLTLARAETAATTPAFRDALRRRRCLVVVDGFFEWRRAEKPSQPFFVRRPDGAPFALAGVWDKWISPDGEIVESCAVVTQTARPPVDTIHDRMPVVLEKSEWDRWLDPAITDPELIARDLEPHTPELVAYAVGTRVNDPRNDDPQVVEPGGATPPPQQKLF